MYCYIYKTHLLSCTYIAILIVCPRRTPLLASPGPPAIHFHNKIVTNGTGNKIWRENHDLCERNVIIYVVTWDLADDGFGANSQRFWMYLPTETCIELECSDKQYELVKWEYASKENDKKSKVGHSFGMKYYTNVVNSFLIEDTLTFVIYIEQCIYKLFISILQLEQSILGIRLHNSYK